MHDGGCVDAVEGSTHAHGQHIAHLTVTHLHPPHCHQQARALSTHTMPLARMNAWAMHARCAHPPYSTYTCAQTLLPTSQPPPTHTPTHTHTRLPPLHLVHLLHLQHTTHRVQARNWCSLHWTTDSRQQAPWCCPLKTG